MLSKLFNKYRERPFVRDRHIQLVQKTGAETHADTHRDTHRDKQTHVTVFRQTQIQIHTTENGRHEEHKVENSIWTPRGPALIFSLM